MEICQISDCINNPIAICLHCQHQLCVEHLLQHNEELIQHANMYCDEYNELTEQIQKLSFDKQFQSAEEDLHDWINDHMKQLDKIYAEKLFELKQKHEEVNENLRNFQQMKLNEIQHRLFNCQLSKQVSLDQLNRMKTAVEQLRKDIDQFKTQQCSINLVNNDQMNYSYQPNIDIQFRKINSDDNKTIVQVDPECHKLIKSALRPDAKPFEYIPKHQNCESLSSDQQDAIRLFDEYTFVRSINKTL